ncbi:hypothetical protein GMORB2_2758 [Geosmithia morbida]|uniref:Uncharacterized protein n=1 Tax=Geosmithia morbida TaxID=1094350 RepID=A0A9P5D3Q8_9HYPO|nr:uncharacterized protein GMORB2_2758 [Geosmithia morbida]KAF4120754.1 hypothetical protein GMORB2_2758 [Geosmithia morbida]
MPPTTIRTPPSVEDYTPLEEFQTQTPETFVGGKPILHLYVSNAKATVPKSQTGVLAVFPADAPAASINTDGEAEQLVERQVDVFVNSENFTIFSRDAEAGVSIPYPSISIHAVKQVADTPAVWMQLEFSDGGGDDDDFSCVELTIVPPAASTTSPEDADTRSPAVRLYEALAACSNLHPDPQGDEYDEDDEDRIVIEGSADHEALEGFTGVLHGSADGSLPPPMPGSGGWITADNVNDYFDEEGNWIGGGDGAEEAGDESTNGAGRTRAHEEIDGEDVNGQVSEEAKRPRVD